MGLNYTALAATALRLIKENGQALPFTRTPDTAFEAGTGVVTKGTPVVQTIQCLPIPATSIFVGAFDDKKREDYITGKTRFFIVAAKDLVFTPAVGDLLTFEGTLWETSGVTPLNPAGVPILYTMRVDAGNKTL